jgi:hypothetical protein
VANGASVLRVGGAKPLLRIENVNEFLEALTEKVHFDLG